MAGVSFHAFSPLWFALSAALEKTACSVIAQWLPHRLHLGWVSTGGTEGQWNLSRVGFCSVNAFCKVLFSPLSQTIILFLPTICTSSLAVIPLALTSSFDSLTHLPSPFCPDGNLVLGIIVAIFGVISVLYIVNKVVKLVQKNGIASSFYSCGEYSSICSDTNWDRYHSLCVCECVQMWGEKVGSCRSALLQGQRNTRTR